MTDQTPATPASTVREAIEDYIQHKETEGSSPERLNLLRVALLALFEPAMDEPAGTLTPLRVVLLGGQLRQGTRPQTGRQLATSTFKTYLLIARTFVAWCSTRWPQTAEKPGGDQAEPGKRSKQHLGELIRLLRTDAGLTRQQLGNGTRLGEMAIKNIELRRRLPTRAQLDLLLKAPAMDRLLAWAERERIPVELAPDYGGDEPAGDDVG